MHTHTHTQCAFIQGVSGDRAEPSYHRETSAPATHPGQEGWGHPALAPKGAAGAGVQGHAATLDGRLAASYRAEQSLTICPKVLTVTDPTGSKSFIQVKPA